jgi:hypothetical protein
VAKNGTNGTRKKGGTSSRKRDSQAEFLIALAESGVVAAALTASGGSRTTVYRWRADDPEFAARWDEALDIAVEVCEGELHRRSVVGVVEPVFYQGAECGSIRRYSDNLLMFRLKALRPEKYRDAVANTVINVNDDRNAIDPAVALAALEAAEKASEGKPPAPRLRHFDRN